MYIIIKRIRKEIIDRNNVKNLTNIPEQMLFRKISSFNFYINSAFFES